MNIGAKTPACKRRPIRTASPARTPYAVAFINNDEEERRQRRLDAHTRSGISPLAVPSTAWSRRGTGGQSTLSNAQIAEHYADCIKLSSENKINVKNAFGLHLIDYMLEMLVERGELENFQVAGCTLDAGAKIYASRVDSIYTDAYKILGGIGKKNHSKAESPDSSVLSVERPKKEHSESSIEANIKVINLSSKELQSQLDPFFQHIEGRKDEEFMLFQLVTREDYVLLLDMHDTSECLHSDPSEVHGLEEMLTDITDAMTSCEICRPFAVVEESCMANLDTSMLICTAESSVSDQQPDYSMLPYPSVRPDSDSEEVLLDPIFQDGDFEMLDNAEVVNNDGDKSALGVCGNKNIAVMVDVNHIPQEKKFDVEYGDLIVTSNELQSDYSYFDPSSTWAGLQHWKLSSAWRNEAKEKACTHVPSHRREALRISFHSTTSEICFLASKSCTVDVGLMSSTGLPEDAHLTLNSLLELFLHSKWKVEKQKMTVSAEAVDDSWYRCEEGFHDADDDHASFNVDADHASFNVSDATFSQLLKEDEVNGSHLHLVTEPRKVEKLSIQYSKKAKKIDAKKLKDTMWAAIKSESLMPAGRMNLSNVCFWISEHFPPSLRHDITAPICFVFLLHLANEKSLALFDDTEFSDVEITLQEQNV